MQNDLVRKINKQKTEKSQQRKSGIPTAMSFKNFKPVSRSKMPNMLDLTKNSESELIPKRGSKHDEILQMSDAIQYRKQTTGSQERGNLRVSGSKTIGNKKDSVNLQQSQNGGLLASHKFDGSFLRMMLRSEEGEIQEEMSQEESNRNAPRMPAHCKSSMGLDFLDVKREIQNELKQVDKKVIEKFAKNQKKKVSYINTMNLI